MTNAETIIGSHDPTDWTLRPTRPSSDLETKAPLLWARLHEDDVMGPAQRYDRADEAAAAAQNIFKAAARRANVAVLVVASLGAATTAAGALDSVLSGHGSTVILACGLLSLVVGALATMWLTFAREGKLLDEWMANRAKAETARIEYFDRATTLQAGDDPKLPQLQLEYFRRYQLEVQLAYYSGRGEQHRKAAQRTLKLRMGALFVGTVANGLAGALGSHSVPYAALGSLAVIAGAWGAFATSTSATNQDGRNAERYARTYDTLTHIRDRLGEVRKALSAAEVDVLPSFVKAVNDELSLEHRQWLQEEDRYAGALQELEQKLAQLKGGDQKGAPKEQANG
jgi:hypothetical protein